MRGAQATVPTIRSACLRLTLSRSSQSEDSSACHRPRQCRQSEPPRRHIERELVPQRSRAREQRSRVVVAAEMRMNRRVDTELAESADSVRGSRIVEQCDQFVP